MSLAAGIKYRYSAIFFNREYFFKLLLKSLIRYDIIYQFGNNYLFPLINLTGRFLTYEYT